MASKGRELREAMVGSGQQMHGTSPSTPTTAGGKVMQFVQSSNMLDLLGLVVLLVVAVATDGGKPRQAFVVKQFLNDNNSYPYHKDTVPSWTVPVFSILGPLLCFAAYKWLAKRSHYEVYRLSVNFLFACLLTGAITNSLKLGVGRLRPNFAVRCWPSGNQTFLPAAPNLDVGIIGGAVCDASVPQSIQNEIRKSWPSGHSSWSAAGLGYFSLFLLGQLHVWAGAGWGWRVVLSLAPTFGAIAVGVTRIIDYWHHPSDVITGLCLGWGIAFILYRQLYPCLTHPNCDQPLYVLQGSYGVYANVYDMLPASEAGERQGGSARGTQELNAMAPSAAYTPDASSRV